MATLFENESVLPGVITEILPSYSEEYDTSLFGTTESILIIGTAFNGPVGRVVPVYSPTHAKYVFGDSFDSATRKEASLIAEIQDAWDRGNRTIYAIRVSGKDMYKDYDLAVETDLKLRVSAYFPSNINKDCFFVYDAAQVEGQVGKIKIYKPASKATISEKMRGAVDSTDTILVNEIDLDAYSITKNHKLSDVITLFNDNLLNNGLRLSIVNKEGADVTNTDKNAHAISVGAMFPGIYTICRNANDDKVVATTEIEYVNNDKTKLYEGFEGLVWKKLVLNTDVTASVPVYATKNKELADRLAPVGIIADENYEWVKVLGSLNKVFLKDSVDYEEVELDRFDLYKRLGSGYAKTAKIKEIEKNGKKFFKVIETPLGDENRVIGIVDGVYSMLENYGTDYRVLGCATAEDKITSRLPKKEEFKISNPNTISLTDDQGETVLFAKAKVDEKDFNAAVNYEISIVQDETLDRQQIMKNLETSVKYKKLPVITTMYTEHNFADGQFVLLQRGFDAVETVSETDTEGKKTTKATKATEVTYKLVMWSNQTKCFQSIPNNFWIKDEAGNVKNKFAMSDVQGGQTVLVPLAVELTNDSHVIRKETIVSNLEQKYVILEGKVTNVVKVANGYLQPVATLKSILELEQDEDYTIPFIDVVTSSVSSENRSKSIVRIVSNKLEWNTYNDLIQDLNENEELANLFTFSPADPMLVAEDTAQVIKGAGLDRGEATYDTNKYIPYITSDNFARQLAQHAMYTSLKNYPTHAVIGCQKLNGVTLNAISERVDAILNLNLDLYAKKSNGNNMLDKDNMPYHIGRCLSLTFIQYGVTTGNGYTYISNGASGYAATLSLLPAGRSSTNYPISLPSLAYELSNYQLGKLTKQGIVVCKNSDTGIVIADGVTQAPIDSPFVRYATTKVLNITSKVLTESLKPFIGLQDNLTNRNSLETAIKSSFNKLLDNLIRAYDYKVVTDAQAENLGVIKVDYKIVPTNEIREIRNRIEVK